MTKATTKDTCLFCNIVAGRIPATIVYKSPEASVFADIDPKAPIHWLVIPNQHADNLSQANPEQLTAVFRAVQAVTQQHGLTDYRVTINNGAAAGQSVFHLHAHVLAGRAFAWPPG